MNPLRQSRPRPGIIMARMPGVCLALWMHAQAQEAPSYQVPPTSIVRMIDAPEVPAAYGVASPQGRWILIDEIASAPSSEALATPTLTLAPWRVDPKTNAAFGVLTFSLVKHIAVYDSDSGRPRELEPHLTNAGIPLWSPDGRRFALLRAGSPGAQLWVGDPQRGEVHLVPRMWLNAARIMPTPYSPDRLPCTWFADGRRLLCLAVPADRGQPPSSTSQGQAGPTLRDTQGADSKLTFRPKYDTFLQSSRDEMLYDYYMTAQPIVIDTLNNQVVTIGTPGIYKVLSPSPDGRYLLSVRIQKPYSYEAEDEQFPSVTEILDSAGRLVNVIATTPQDTSGAGGSLFGNVSCGPRQFFWQPTAPSTLAYYQALDGGVAKQSANYRDSLRLIAAPFNSDPVQVFRSRGRMGTWPVRSLWGANGLLILEEWDGTTQQRRAWKLNTRAPGGDPELLWSYHWNQRDETDSDGPGEFMTALGPTTGRGWMAESHLQDGVLLQSGNWVYLRGVGKSPSGDRPFLDRFNLGMHQKGRVFESPAGAYDEVISVLDPRARRLLIATQNATIPPNIELVDRSRGKRIALTHFSDPLPELTRDRQQTVRYFRADGLPLTGRLYLPTDYRSGDRPPVILQGYPALSGVNKVKPLPENRFRGVSPDGESPLPLISRGYAVFVADMPLTGGKVADDTNNEQLAADAKAAIDKLVDMGIADRARIGVVGHSYGGFMVANLLENTNLFVAGVAFSGLYNLTLVPTWLQYEAGRSYWQAPEVWDRMSPFRHADKMTAPLLLLHGENDGSSGATARQSIGMFEALESLGKTSRLVVFPNESHVLRGREAMLHAQWEMLRWFDRYLKKIPVTPEARAPKSQLPN